MPPGIVAAVVLKVGDASADFLLSSKVVRLGALGRDFPEGLASLEHAKEVAARRMKKSWDVTVALLHVLVSPEHRMSWLEHFSSRTTTRNLSMTWRLAIHAIDLILSKQFLLGVHLQLELGGDNLEDTGGWELYQNLQVASGQVSTCSP